MPILELFREAFKRGLIKIEKPPQTPAQEAGYIPIEQIPSPTADIPPEQRTEGYSESYPKPDPEAVAEEWLTSQMPKEAWEREEIRKLGEQITTERLARAERRAMTPEQQIHQMGAVSRAAFQLTPGGVASAGVLKGAEIGVEKGMEALSRIPFPGEAVVMAAEALRKGAIEGEPLNALNNLFMRMGEKVVEGKFLTLEEAAGVTELPAWAKISGEVARFGLDFTTPAQVLKAAKLGAKLPIGAVKLAMKAPEKYGELVEDLVNTIRTKVEPALGIEKRTAKAGHAYIGYPEKPPVPEGKIPAGEVKPAAGIGEIRTEMPPASVKATEKATIPLMGEAEGIPSQQTSMDKFSKVMSAVDKESPKVRAEYAELLKEKAVKLAEAQATEKGIAGYEAGRKALSGGARRVGELVSSINDTDIGNLLSAVQDSAQLTIFQKHSAQEGLMSLLTGGTIPQPKQRVYLDVVFGKETVEGIIKNKDIVKGLVSPDDWVKIMSRRAKRELSPELDAKIRDAAGRGDSEELRFIMSNIRKFEKEKIVAEAADAATASISLDKYKKTIEAEIQDAAESIGAEGRLKDLQSIILRERGLPLNDIKSFTSEIQQRIRMIREETLGRYKAVRMEEKAISEVTDLFYKAQKISGKDLTPEVKLALRNAVKAKDADAINSILDAIKKPSTYDRVLDVMGVPKAIRYTLDVSFALRQGIFFVGHPKEWIPSAKNMFTYLFDEAAYNAAKFRIQTNPLYRIERKYGVAFVDMGAGVKFLEETRPSRFVEKIPVIGRPIRASNRAYNGMANDLRHAMFEKFYNGALEAGMRNPKALSEVHPDVIKNIASLVNNGTGRGDLSILEGAARELNLLFASPRLIASRARLLNPVYYIKLDPYTRKQALYSLSTMIGAGLTALEIAYLAGADVELNPLSSDFATIKIGNTRYDPWGGFKTYVVLVARLITNQQKVDKKVKELGKEYGQATRFDKVVNFFTGKASPIGSFVVDFAKGKDYEGNEFRLTKETADLFIPLILKDFADIYKEGGVKKLPMAVPAALGIGVDTYKVRKHAPRF